MAAVECERLVRRYDDVTALDGISFEVERGELFGVIGPDGAGKTTLFRILTGLLVPDEGTASVLDFSARDGYREIRRRVGYMPGQFSLYGDLSVEENLRFFASVFGSDPDRRDDLIAPAYRQLEPFGDRRASDLSGGMKQKLALSCALVHRPEVLVLDEPTTGVDAVSRREFWDLLAQLKEEGLTILVSTPYMDEASRCDRVALIDQGRILQIDTPEAIGRSYDRPLFSVRGGSRYRLLRTLREHPRAASAYPFGADIHLTDERAGAEPEALAETYRDWLRERGFEDAEVRPIPAGIEDVFMARMGAEAAAPNSEAASANAASPISPTSSL